MKEKKAVNSERSSGQDYQRRRHNRAALSILRQAHHAPLQDPLQ
jgi:hypothetical protein